MAEALLAGRLRATGHPLRARSAGLHAIGGPADENAQKVLSARGLDLSGHQSRSLTSNDITKAAIVLAMERAHIAEIAAFAPEAFPKTFGLTEIVAVGRSHEPRQVDEGVSDWAHRLHAQRRPADVLKSDVTFDIADPHGGALVDYERCADQLTQLIDSFVRLLGPYDPERSVSLPV